MNITNIRMDIEYIDLMSAFGTKPTIRLKYHSLIGSLHSPLGATTYVLFSRPIFSTS